MRGQQNIKNYIHFTQSRPDNVLSLK